MERANIKLKNGQTLEIHRDEFAESPREWDNICKMICFHTCYNIGDKHDIDHGAYNSWEELQEENFDTDAIIVPIYAYTKGGINLATHPFMCRWDSGRVGFAVITKQEIIDSYGEDSPANRARAKRCIESELKTYNDYLSGECYGFILKDKDGEEIDSCFGFYGYDPTTNGIFDHLDISEEDCYLKGEEVS